MWESLRHRAPRDASARHALVENLALAYALRGELERAREVAMQGPQDPTCTDLLIAVRSGVVADLPAVRMDEGIHGARLVALLRALAAAASGKREEAIALLEQARPKYKNEFDYLGEHWPALSEILAADPWRHQPVTELRELSVDDLRPLESVPSVNSKCAITLQSSNRT